MSETDHRVELGGSFRASVEVGQHVDAGGEIARRLTPRGVTRVSLARKLRVPPKVAGEHVVPRPGERVEPGGVIARGPDGREVRASIEGSFLWYSADQRAAVLARFDEAAAVTSPVSGRIEEVDLRGIVIRVPGQRVRGVDGSGEPAHGELLVPVASGDEELRPAHVNSLARGKIIVGGSRVSAETLSRARAMGVSGVVVGAAVDRELRDFLAADERRRAASREHGVSRSGAVAPFGVLLLEGYGRAGIPNAIFGWLNDHAGRRATLLGNERTLYVYGADEPPGFAHPPSVGDEVVVHRLPHAGAAGRLISELSTARFTPSGLATRTGVVRLQDGSLITVALANLETVTRPAASEPEQHA